MPKGIAVILPHRNSQHGQQMLEAQNDMDVAAKRLITLPGYDAEVHGGHGRQGDEASRMENYGSQ